MIRGFQFAYDKVISTLFTKSFSLLSVRLNKLAKHYMVIICNPIETNCPKSLKRKFGFRNRKSKFIHYLEMLRRTLCLKSFINFVKRLVQFFTSKTVWCKKYWFIDKTEKSFHDKTIKLKIIWWNTLIYPCPHFRHALLTLNILTD